MLFFYSNAHAYRRYIIAAFRDLIRRKPEKIRQFHHAYLEQTFSLSQNTLNESDDDTVSWLLHQAANTQQKVHEAILLELLYEITSAIRSNKTGACRRIADYINTVTQSLTNIRKNHSDVYEDLISNIYAFLQVVISLLKDVSNETPPENNKKMLICSSFLLILRTIFQYYSSFWPK